MAVISAALPILLWDVLGAFPPSVSLPWRRTSQVRGAHGDTPRSSLLAPRCRAAHSYQQPSSQESQHPLFPSPLQFTSQHPWPHQPHFPPDEAGSRATAAFPPSTHVLRAGFEPQTPWTCPAPINLQSDNNYYQCHFQHEQNNLFSLFSRNGAILSSWS